MRVLASVGFVLAFTLGACGFTPGSFTSSDAGPDGPPPITVGFAKTTTLADETSNEVAIRVVLSQPATEAISVAYAITGGTATQTVDYLGSDGTVTFAPGEVEQAIMITVGPDGMEEPDETIELELQSVTGGNAVLATRTHTMTIAANVLPRVSFSLASSMDTEATTTKTFDVTLSSASPLQVSVEVGVMGGTATAGGVDFTLSTSTVVFAANDTMEQVTLTINNDTMDEDNETAVIALDNGINVIVGTTNAHTYTIEDNDAAPTIAFASAASAIGEDGTGIDVTVQLSAVSGKAIEIPFTVANTSTATTAADYAIPTTSPLMFAPGEAQKTIRVNMVQDTMLETPETVVLDLGTPMNATLAAPSQHTVTINDDDATCLGTGAYVACFATPNNTVTISGTIDTDGAGCATPLSGWTGQPSSCFIVADTLNVGASTVIGSRPLVLFARSNLTITGNMDAASHRGGTTGPGAAGQTCAAFTRAPQNSTSGAGGGAGGSFRSAGGTGGNGNGADDSGGAPAAAVGTPAALRAGCRGQNGGRGNSPPMDNGGLGGLGGGAVYLVAGGTITVDSGVTINASGAGAARQTAPANGQYAGGGGGGSGGMIKLHANAFSVSGARFMANGGGGSSGGDNNAPGVDGNDPTVASPTNGGTPGSGGGGGASGGAGFGSATTVGNGNNGGSNTGGGGGGGGGGHIEANLALTGATVSAVP